MPVAISCPACSKTIGVPDDAAGRRLRCPLCRAAFSVEEEPVEAIPVPQAELVEDRPGLSRFLPSLPKIPVPSVGTVVGVAAAAVVALHAHNTARRVGRLVCRLVKEI